MMYLQRSNGDTAEEPEGTSASGRFSMKPSLPMQNNRVSISGSKTANGVSTIDDAIQLADELHACLSKLGEYKHPLDVRRGRKGVASVMDQNIDSRTVKAGSKTYFFDIKETKNGKPYLIITESRFKGESEERERRTIIVFQENAKEFAEAVSEMTDKLE